MTPNQAAQFIGMSVAQVRQACRKGLIKATKRRLDNGDPNAFYWDISETEARRYKYNRPSPGPKKGFLNESGNRLRQRIGQH